MWGGAENDVLMVLFTYHITIIAERLSTGQLILHRISERVCIFICHAQECNYCVRYGKTYVSAHPSV